MRPAERVFEFLQKNTKSLFSITFSPEGRFVATGSEDGYFTTLQ